MKKNLTELVFILDRSGSMQGLEGDTIGGFNAMIEKQKKEPGEAFVSTVLFDDRAEVLHDRVKLGEVRPITEKEYYVRGCTALLDAIGGAIHHIGNIHKYARPEDVPEHTLFVITTDGMENASSRYTLRQVAKMIAALKEEGWSFNFIGANIDVKATAASLNIDNSLEFQQDDKGTQEMFARESRSRNRWFERTAQISYCIAPDGCSSPEERKKAKKKFKEASKNYFDI